MGPTQKPNVCRQLSRRALGFFSRDAGVVQRTNLGILRVLVCQESTKFKNVWTTHSKSPIAYERGRIYFDNYRCCVSSVASEPRKLYEMPKCSKSEKIEDALLWECPVIFELGHSSRSYCSQVSSKQMFSIGPAGRHSTAYFAVPCSVPCFTFFTHRDSGDQQEGDIYLSPQIFGNVTDATLSHGILIVMYSSGLVRLYSFQAIIEQFMQQKLDLGCACRWGGTAGTVGEAPFGIPCNIKITDSPPLLFEVSSLENAFQIGGHPWHYIITPNKKKQKGVFHICALKDNSLAKNGIQEMECCSLESDWIYFHPDASGRIIHVGPNQVKVLKLNEVENNSAQHQISEDFVILANREKNKNENLLTVTASGRVVKKKFNLLDDDPEQETFKIVDYEDELDLLSVVAVTQIDAEGKAHLDFHCNEYGTLLKSIPLEESWDVTYSHEVYFDRDLVLHIEQKPSRVFSCYVYQMVCDPGEEETTNRSCEKE
ncbi:DDB1- and CUL4-associated factor 17 isoform X3 [Lynx canadensis]|uniref:DDB1- and CUL4-associated factor 17 isoform X3 n=1 Tax=Lynx canadensis TaxID=61383 RepID=UPI0011B0AF45|nr:DDB1- and CUL4-associated factor 17 isoform X3 [Lynx canadensis]XP_046940554.1 DDB1- and CUL4-associated factor 17 isoform X2 [Lynx rufus]